MDRKKALIVWGGWEGHTPKQSAELAARWLTDRGFDVEVRDTLDVYLDRDRLMSLSLIVQIWTMGQISPEQWQGLNQAVQSGVGLAGFHGGIIDAFRQNTDYQWMTGGQWVAHPGNSIPSYRVHIVDREHPITRGIDDFELRDTEQYYVHVDPANHVLATTRFEGGYGDVTLYRLGAVVPYAWIKTWGKGKVFVACWGHTYRDFDVPEAVEITARGMVWAAR